MIKLGITGQVDSFHSNCICSIVNGVIHSPRKTWGVGEKMPELGGFRIEAIYSPHSDVATDVAAAFSIPHITSSLEELAGIVDGVLILCEKDVTEHYKIASIFLERHVPVYIDKPLAETVEEALSVVRIAQKHGTPMLSCSARRFDPLIVEGTAILRKECHKPLSAYVFGDWRYTKMIWYGVHAIDVLFAVLGPDVVSVRDVGDIKHRILRLTYRNGLVAIVDLPYDIGVGTSVVVFGKRDAQHLYWYLGTGRTHVFFAGLLERIGCMIQSGIPPVSYAEMVHVIRVLNAAEQSLRENREIFVDMNVPI